MKVHKNDIEQIKRYCEENGYGFDMPNHPQCYALVICPRKGNLIRFSSIELDKKAERFLIKVQQDCIRRNRELDKIIKGGRDEL